MSSLVNNPEAPDSGTAISAQDRESLRASVSDLLRRRGTSEALRAAMTTPNRTDEALWSTLSTEIGVTALPIPEAYGGTGATFAESAVVLEELGAALAPVPALSSAVCTAAVLLSADTEAAARLLEPLAAGASSLSLCWAGPQGWARPAVVAEGGLLNGTVHFVADAPIATTFLVIAGGGDSVTLHEVDADAGGVEISQLPTMDPTRGLSTVTFADTPSTPIATPPHFMDALRAHAWALLSAEQVGAARSALERTVEYSKARSQFGRVIGSFQALKHRMADMYTLTESARSMSVAAIDALVVGAPDAYELAACAHVYCSESLSTVAAEAIQIHGGIGITWEHDIGLYFKRAHGTSMMFGAPHEVVAALSG